MKKYILAYPYLFWVALFTVVPLGLIFFFGLTVKTPEGYSFCIDNMYRVFEPLYLQVMWRSIYLAVISTLACLILGYPLAMILSDDSFTKKTSLFFLLIIPMWMNFLLRTYAWLTLLEKKGLINTMLNFMHLPTINILYTDYAVMLGMVYNFLPFMVLPIYSVLIKIDRSLIDAAEDLGANKWTAFWRVVFPLSLPGVYAGILMVFMPAVTTFVISRLLGGGQYTLVGNLIEQQFLVAGDWSFGSALSIVMMILILCSMGFMMRYEKENEGGMLG